MRRRNESVHNGVGDCGLADDLVPVFGGKLTGHDGGAPPLPVFEHFEEVAAFAVGERREAEVVEDEDIGFRQAVHDFGIGAVSVSDKNFLKHSGNSHVQRAVSFSAGFVGEGARYV
jgi:hypothetical protein